MTTSRPRTKAKSRSGTNISAAERRAAGQALLQGIWMPAALYERVDRKCERRGLTRAAGVREALEEWLK